MYKKITGLLLILLLLLPTLASAENEPIHIKSLEIQVMPEFISPADWPKDTASLLTGIYGSLVNEGTTAYAGPISIPIPKAPNTSIHVVAEFKDQESSETEVKYEFNPDQNTVVWKPNQAIEPNQVYYFVVEYYSNPFVITNKEHQFNFSLSSLYGVDDVQLYIYKPTDSIDFTLSEKHDKTFKNEIGQEIYQLSLGSLNKSVEKSMSVKYLKDNFETVMDKHSKTTQESGQNAAGQGAAGSTGSKVDATGGAGTGLGADSSIGSAGDAPKQDASKDSWIIGGSIVIFGLLVYMGLRSFRAPIQAAPSTDGDTAARKRQQIRALRKQLLDEQLTEEQYVLEREKWV